MEEDKDRFRLYEQVRWHNEWITAVEEVLVQVEDKVVEVDNFMNKWMNEQMNE